jgi:polyisoprenyl-phosphate glycosyltransferase
MSKCISIVVPVFNEEENIEPLLERLDAIARHIQGEFNMQVEVIINDNHSTDRSFDMLRACAERHDPLAFDLRLFRFARNIGFQKSILVGYCKARGDVVAQIDADLQDPPELILDFMRKWQEGYKVVYGVRRSRDEGAVMQMLRRQFYRLIDRVSPDDLPLDSGDFRLIDRSIVDVICKLRDHDPYLRGFVATLGLKQIGIPYDRKARQRGASKFGLSELAKLAIDGITNHSAFPLRLASYIGLAGVLVATALILYYFCVWLFFAGELPLGFLTQTLLQLGSLAALSFLIAIQGLYINRIYNQVKERPLAIIEHSVHKPVAGQLDLAETDNRVEVLWTGETFSAPPQSSSDADRP